MMKTLNIFVVLSFILFMSACVPLQTHTQPPVFNVYVDVTLPDGTSTYAPVDIVPHYNPPPMVKPKVIVKQVIVKPKCPYVKRALKELKVDLLDYNTPEKQVVLIDRLLALLVATKSRLEQIDAECIGHPDNE